MVAEKDKAGPLVLCNRYCYIFRIMRAHNETWTGTLAVALAVLLLAGSALAQNLNLKAPSLANMHGRLTVSFGVTVDELPILKGELEDGATLVLKCMVGLFEANDYWLDSEISTGGFVSILRYDALTREYTMTLPGHDTALRNRDIGVLLEEGWSTIRISMGSWALLDRGSKYSLRLQTTMNELDAPEGFMRYIYFWSWDAGAENSFQLDFTY